MSDDLDDIIEELTGSSDICIQCGLQYNECDGHESVYDEDDWVTRERNRPVPANLSHNQIASRAATQIKRRIAHKQIHQLTKGEQFIFDKDTPKHEGTTVLWEHAGEGATFCEIDNSYVKFILNKNPLTKDGRPKIRKMGIYRFIKYFKKVINNATIHEQQGSPT